VINEIQFAQLLKRVERLEWELGEASTTVDDARQLMTIIRELAARLGAAIEMAERLTPTEPHRRVRPRKPS
jgi:uncharacterized coiled-coil DUF342 family protein